MNSNKFNMKIITSKAGLLILAVFSFISLTNAQKKRTNSNTQTEYPEALYSSLEYRLVGPFRGGRSAAVTGVPGEPNLFYFACGYVHGFMEMEIDDDSDRCRYNPILEGMNQAFGDAQESFFMVCNRMKLLTTIPLQ